MISIYHSTSCYLLLMIYYLLLEVRTVAPPPFMGPPDGPPGGAMLAAPLELPEPAHVQRTRLVRPHAMEPPCGAPSGGACGPPLTPATSYHLDFGRMTVAARGAHMTGLQQLSTMCQLLRSVAAATREVQQGELLMGSVGGVAQVSKYVSR